MTILQSNSRYLSRGTLAVLFATTMIFSQIEPAIGQSISLTDNEAQASVQRHFESLSSQIKDDAAIAAQGSGNGPAVYVDLNAPLDRDSTFPSLQAADQAFMRAAKKTYDLYRSMGGETLDRRAVIQHQEGRFYVGFDGEGGRWLASSEEALSFLMQELVQQSTFFLKNSKSAAAQCPLRFDCILLAAYSGQIETIAYVPRGTTVTLTLTGDGFKNEGGPPVVLVPTDLTVHDVVFIDSASV